MEYYFTVTLNYGPYTKLLVKAKDVFEAGNKVEDLYLKEDFSTNGIDIIDITRTNITKVIE